MSAEDKIRLLGVLWRSAWSLKKAWLKQSHPEWSEEQLRRTVLKAFAHGH